MKPKLAVADLLLHYPPKGGACVDLFSVLTILQRDFEIRIFCPQWSSAASSRGQFAEPPPFPAETVDVGVPTRASVVGSLTEAVAGWRPDAVLVADGWTLKPYLINALKRRWPVVARIYAYEGLCPRNNERWLPDGACPRCVLSDAVQCLDCAKSYFDIVRERRGGGDNPLTEEMAIAEIFSGDYGAAVKEAFSGLRCVVYNKFVARLLEELGGAKAVVAPGGVDAALFHPGEARAEGVFSILVAGRMADHAKGASTALEAGALLASEGRRFKMSLTREPQEKGRFPWLDECGWKSQEDLAGMMREASCAAIPSRWEEAFGMVWAEAMASGLPVVASAVPGPMEYIVDDRNGLLFPPGDAKALAKALARLMDDAATRRRLLAEGLRTAREELGWEKAAAKTREAIVAAIDSFSVR